MPDSPDNTLSYAGKPSALGSLANYLANNRRFWVKAGIIGFLLLLGFGFLHGPTSGQIRLDTGDLRYYWWGIPLKYERMPEPQRSKLLALASKAPAIPAKWVTCDTDRFCLSFYWSVAIWADEDPKIARWAMDDIVDYIPGMLSIGGLPKSGLVISIAVVDRQARRVDPGWRDNDDVRTYCAEHGYVPPPAPTTSPAK
jgi:hypothetical protein